MSPDGPEHLPQPQEHPPVLSFAPDHQTRQTPFGGATTLQGTGARHSGPGLPSPGTGPLGTLETLQCFTGSCSSSSSPTAAFPAGTCHGHSPRGARARSRCHWGGWGAASSSPAPQTPLPTQTPRPSRAPSPLMRPLALHTRAPHPCTHLFCVPMRTHARASPWDSLVLLPFFLLGSHKHSEPASTHPLPQGVTQRGWWDPALGRVTQSTRLQVSASPRLFSGNKP